VTEDRVAGAPQDVPAADGRSRHWWLHMVLCSAAIVVLLPGLCLLWPAAQLHYHAWRWRSSKDEDSLRRALELVTARRLERDAVVRLMGRPDYEDETLLTYRGRPAMPSPLQRSVELRNGRAVSILCPPRLGGLQQIGLAIRMYADDTEEVFPASAEAEPDRRGGDQREGNR
jgi:hypothetical protein